MDSPKQRRAEGFHREITTLCDTLGMMIKNNLRLGAFLTENTRVICVDGVRMELLSLVGFVASCPDFTPVGGFIWRSQESIFIFLKVS